MKLPSIDLPKRKINDICAVGDLHIGAKACSKTAFRETVKDIRYNRNASVILMGDQLDAIVSGDKRFNPYELDVSLPTLKSQVDYFLRAIKPIRKKIIGLLEGNHEFTIKKKVGYDFSEFLAEQLDTIYLDQSSLLELNCSWGKYSVLAAHGIGGGQTLGGQLRKVQNLMANWESAPDITIVGHWHRLDSIAVPKMDAKLNVRTKHVGFTGSYYRTYVKGAPSYASDKWYSPSRIGYLQMRLTEKRVIPMCMEYHA